MSGGLGLPEMEAELAGVAIFLAFFGVFLLKRFAPFSGLPEPTPQGHPFVF